MINDKYKQKKKVPISHSDKKARFLARFWIYYYPFLILLILYLVKSRSVFLRVFPLSIAFHGIYWLYIAKKIPRHFILMMLDNKKQDMKDAKSWYPSSQIKEWQREARKNGLFEIIIGIVFLLFITLYP